MNVRMCLACTAFKEGFLLMEMHQVRYFVTLCNTLNFTKAAEACNISQPSLTKAIHKLEDELGGPLFCRERNMTHLTRLGKIMEPHLKAVYASTEAAITEANSFLNEGKATLQLGILRSVSPTNFISFFQHFHNEAPNISLSLHHEDQCVLKDKLLTGEIDAAIMQDSNLPDRCDTIPLFNENYALAVPEHHSLAAKNRLSLSELEHVVILPHGLDYPVLQNIPIKEMTHCSGKADWTQSLILAGLGAAILPISTPLLRGIIAIPIDEPSMVRSIALVTIAGRRHAPVLRALRSFATQHNWPTTYDTGA